MFDRSVLEQYFCSEVFGSTVASWFISFPRLVRQAFAQGGSIDLAMVAKALL